MSAMSLCPRPSFPKALKSMYLPPVDSTLAASPNNFLVGFKGSMFDAAAAAMARQV